MGMKQDVRRGETIADGRALRNFDKETATLCSLQLLLDGLAEDNLAVVGGIALVHDHHRENAGGSVRPVGELQPLESPPR